MIIFEDNPNDTYYVWTCPECGSKHGSGNRIPSPRNVGVNMYTLRTSKGGKRWLSLTYHDYLVQVRREIRWFKAQGHTHYAIWTPKALYEVGTMDKERTAVREIGN